MLAQSDVDGLILPPPLSGSQAILAELALVDMPLVTVAMGLPHQDMLAVGIDDYATASQITEHPIEFGIATSVSSRDIPTMPPATIASADFVIR